MIRRPRRLLAIGFMTLLSIGASPLSAQQGKFDLAKTKTVLSTLIEKAIKEQGVPSISIALVRGDSIVWKEAFGYANVRMKTPATTETYYSTGSTFKAATATAIMQLADQGKLKIDQPVNQYLGDVQVQDRIQVEKPVTFRHILSHWSGLKAGAVTKPIWGRELPKTLEQMVATLYSVRAPETKYEYNNFAYGMAGLLIEKISGVEYEKYMVENVLKPIGIMTPHPFRATPEMVELMALPYMPGGATGKPTPVEQVHFDVYPAGDIWLRPEEMARFLIAHLNGGVFQGKRILSEASVKQTHEPQFGGTYAFGWSVAKDAASGHTLISHTGGIPGMSSLMLGDTDAKVGVYFMSNSGAPGSIGQAALKLLRGEDYTPPVERKATGVDAATLDKYVGNYALDDIALTVARAGSNLTISVNDGTPMPLLAESKTVFFSKATEWTITFVPNAAGVIDQFVLTTDGDEKQTAKRKK